MMQMPSIIDTIIIGAGPSGLACAIQCQKNNIPFLLVEQSERVGGRVGSVEIDGYIFDLGFQVYNTAYEMTNMLLNLDEIKLNHFKPGAMIYDGETFKRISDPLRDFRHIFSTILSDIPTFHDKLKILKLKFILKGYKINHDTSSDISTYEYLLSQGFSNRIIEMFFKPFFAGIFLENKLKTSSKFFKYVFSKLNIGMASLPEKGMQAIPDDLSNKINAKNIIIGKKAVNIIDQQSISFDDGNIVNAKNVVLTGESSHLVTGRPNRYNSIITLYFSTNLTLLHGKYIHLYPYDELINNIAFPTSISASYSKDGNNLISVNVKENNIQKKEMIKHVQSRLVKYYGGEVQHYQFLKSFEIKKGTFIQLPGHFDQLEKQKRSPYIIGETQIVGSIEGAVQSGLEMADSLIN
ncbi:MAG: hypothetical protein CMG57_07155 [Candidatus Marinimicrobia bacterium]|nr:hypothetical protein [Candidatus Neomarinimicrobiota bacterium]